MVRAKSELLNAVARYYSDKLRLHGATAKGVDWNSNESQKLRFSQLLRLLPRAGHFSVCDLGCGYGGLVEYLDAAGFDYRYLGVDISEDMINHARKLHEGHSQVEFVGELGNASVLDYCVASGIFNVKMDAPKHDWHMHVLDSLAIMDSVGRKGFAFNCLTSYSDPERMQNHLYYANPCELFDHCKRRFSKNVALLHDYGLYEFTVIVRKDL